jgi:methyltransferase (TIGR00027 family)
MLNDISDTALWVAVYRSQESERADALFRDPLASRLTGERGRKIASRMRGARYIAWTVAIRTWIIDGFISELIAEGVDTVINLGAGLDTRPYRLDLPASLRWIEVDYPHMIQLKEDRLASETARCRLERIKLDLTDYDARAKLFSAIDADSRKALVLTEGILPYLTIEQGASLAQDLRRCRNFRFWITEYFSPQAMPYLKRRGRMHQMRNAPFQFFPEDWFGFFNRYGWRARETRYLGDASHTLGRTIPLPWWVTILRIFLRTKDRVALRKFTGYTLFEPIGDTSSNDGH